MSAPQRGSVLLGHSDRRFVLRTTAIYENLRLLTFAKDIRDVFLEPLVLTDAACLGPMPFTKTKGHSLLPKTFAMFSSSRLRQMKRCWRSKRGLFFLGILTDAAR